MNYRELTGKNISSLCFGTATYVKGRLHPFKDSRDGKESLKYALNQGINFIHSNSNLNTQWATREVINLERTDKEYFNIIKIESPLHKRYLDLYNFFKNKIYVSEQNLGVNKIFGIIYEIDIKKTNQKKHLENKNMIYENLSKVYRVFKKLKKQGKTDILVFMAHNELEMNIAIKSEFFDGYSAYFNLINIWPIKFFNRIKKQSKSFIGIRPLNMGVLTDSYFIQNQNNLNKEQINHIRSIVNRYNKTCSIQNFSIKFCLAHPIVKSIIVGMSKIEHVKELMNACKNPLKLSEFNEHYQKLEKIRETLLL